MSVQRQASDAGININISPPDQLKSSCASTELPNQDDVMLRFPTDDITAPFTSCELHIPKGNATIMVALGVFSPPDPTKTPRIHRTIIPSRYVSVSVDRVNKGFNDLALDIPGGDGEKTLVKQRRYSYYGASATSLFPGSLGHRRFLNCQTIGADKSEQNIFFHKFSIDMLD